MANMEKLVKKMLPLIGVLAAACNQLAMEVRRG